MLARPALCQPYSHKFWQMHTATYPLPQSRYGTVVIFCCHLQPLATSDMFPVLIVCLFQNVIYMKSYKMQSFAGGYSSSRVSAWQVWGPEFKSQYCQNAIFVDGFFFFFAWHDAAISNVLLYKYTYHLSMACSSLLVSCISLNGCTTVCFSVCQ
jgi:hypothetical protein